MSPPPAPKHGNFQSEVAHLLRSLLTAGRVITECHFQPQMASKPSMSRGWGLAALKNYAQRPVRYARPKFVLPESFLFRDLPGAGPAIGPRLLTAFGTDRGRFEHSIDFSSLSGIGPIRRASGKKTRKHASVHFRHACPKFLRQSSRVRLALHPLLPLG